MLGLFANLFSKKKTVSTVRGQPTESELRYERYKQSQTDAEYLALSKSYFSTLEKLNSEWSVMYNLKDYNSTRGECFETMCVEQIDIFLKLVPKWQKYDGVVPNTSAFKHLAMLYERQGRIDDAACVCLKAIELGFENDGTKAGMRGRLARLIRSGAAAEMPKDE